MISIQPRATMPALPAVDPNKDPTSWGASDAIAELFEDAVAITCSTPVSISRSISGSTGRCPSFRSATGALLLALALAFAACADSAAAATSSWTETFAAERDTVLFLARDGSLVRAPFDLSSRESLWVARGAERLCRVRVSPDGRTPAWITRAYDGDTTRLWIGSAPQSRPRVRFYAVNPNLLGILHFEAAVPTLEDHDFHGARLLVPGTMMRRYSCNTLEWAPDGSAVVFGTNDGIAAVAPDSGAARAVAASLATDLRMLDPAPLYLTDAIVETGGRRREDWLILFPATQRWRLFPSSGLDRSKPWTAGPATVWWASRNTIHSVALHDPSARIEVRAAAPVIWLRYDEPRRALEWAAGSRILRWDEDGGPERVVIELPDPVQSVLETRGHRGIVAGKRFVLWNSVSDSTRIFMLGDLAPTAMFELAGGTVVLVSQESRKRAARFARLDPASGTIEPFEGPAVKSAIVVASPGGRYLLVAEGGSDPAAVLHVLDPASLRWTEVENPGITGWELLEAR